MKTPLNKTLPIPQAVLDEQSQRFMARGLGWASAALLGLAIFQLSPVLFSFHDGKPFGIPSMSVVAGIFLVSLQQLAHRRWLGGRRLQLAVLSPVVFLALAYIGLFLWRGEAYLAPGMAAVFALCILPAGLSLHPRLPLWAGLLGALGHLAAVETARLQGVLPPNMPYGLFFLHSLLVGVFGVGLWLITRLSSEILQRAVKEEDSRIRESALLGAYFSEEVKAKVLQEGAHLAPERHLVAILFCDLRGFTGWAEERDPAEVVTHLNEYFDAIVKVIQAHGGTVDKFIGDAVLAVFGGLRSLENPCEAALRSAIAMRRAVARLHLEWEERGLPPLDIGVGIHFGEVVQGPLGSQGRREFTVIGDTVNVAARIESLTRELKSPILLSSTAAESVNPRLRQRLLKAGEFEVKGKKALVTLFRLQPSESTDDFHEEKSLPPLPLKAVPVRLKT